MGNNLVVFDVDCSIFRMIDSLARAANCCILANLFKKFQTIKQCSSCNIGAVVSNVIDPPGDEHMLDPAAATSVDGLKKRILAVGVFTMSLCSAAFDNCSRLWTIGKRGARSCEGMGIEWRSTRRI